MLCLEEFNAIRNKKIKKEIEDSFKSFMAKYFDKGPRYAKVYIVDDCITIYCKDFLTVLEKSLSKGDFGNYYVKLVREKVSENYSSLMMKMIYDITGLKVKNFYLDCNAIDNSLCCAFILEAEIEAS